jgi:hypothetical protein
MTAITIDQRPVHTTTTTTKTSARTPVWRVSAAAALVAAVATELFGLVARAIDVPMEAGSFGAEHADKVFVGGFAFSTFVYCAIGTVVAAVVARRAKNPARTWVVIAVAGTALSLVFPIFAGDTATATKVVLSLAHVLAALIVIPPVARRLAE